MDKAHPPLDAPDGPPANGPPNATLLSNPLEEGPASHQPELVSQRELNAWRRGFTPQAEIWNGRLAMLGLSVGLSVLLVARLIHR